MNIRIILTLAALIASIALLYIAVFYLPQREAAKAAQQELINSRECRAAALALHNLDGEGDSKNTFQMEPLYVYVPSEKLCLYKGGFFSEIFTREYLKNVMTNETIAEYVSVDGRDFKGTKNEFKEIQGRYFKSADGR